jgi:DNA topoisomerase I
MLKKLVIVESPTKAKTLKRFLGRDYTIKASVGHVIDLPKSQFGIDIEQDFKPKYITIRGKGEVLKELKAARKKADKIYLAGDPDREGEAICWHLANALDISCDSDCRVEFNEITKDAVKKAFQNPRAIDQNRVNAQQARRILDRVVGYKISPLLWKNVKKGLSAGRVQSVAVRLICEREEEIDSFVSEEYWSITAHLTPDLKKNSFEAKFTGKNGKKMDLGSEKEVKDILKGLEGLDFQVASVEKKQKKRHPAPPFSTSSLQQEASRKLGFPPSKTMKVAQQLYEGVALERKKQEGLITYMRTDALRVSNESLTEVRKYIQENIGPDYLPASPRLYKSKKGAQEAHEAVRPTSTLRTPEKVKSYLSKDQNRLYKLIWDRFVASQMESAIMDTVKVDINAGPYNFRATGSTIKFPGFMSLYIEGKDTQEGSNGSLLPELAAEQLLKVLNVDPKQHFTQPPPRYSEAMLVKALEERGIGRPSTYASIISTIMQRGYVIRENKVLKPTELGVLVVGILKEYFQDIMDVDFTAQMEERLDEVADGRYPWLHLLREFYGPFEEKLHEAEKKMEKIQVADEESEEKCPKCQRNLVYKMGRFGKFLACPGFPECRFTKPIVKEAGVDCPACGKPLLLRKTKRGRLFYGCSDYPECQFTSWSKPVAEKCPECQSHLVEKNTRNKSVLACSNKECKYKK